MKSGKRSTVGNRPLDQGSSEDLCAHSTTRPCTSRSIYGTPKVPLAFIRNHSRTRPRRRPPFRACSDEKSRPPPRLFLSPACSIAAVALRHPHTHYPDSCPPVPSKCPLPPFTDAWYALKLDVSDLRTLWWRQTKRSVACTSPQPLQYPEYLVPYLSHDLLSIQQGPRLALPSVSSGLVRSCSLVIVTLLSSSPVCT